MDLQPRAPLTEQQVNRGLKLVIADGLAAEAMTTLTAGAFLVALALLAGASNFQIGLLAALPTLTNIFQLVSIWLVRRFNNRRIVTVVSSVLARLPLILIGLLIFVTPDSRGIEFVIILLFFHYLFGSIAGPGWNAWMKDLVPEKRLGDYFARRTSYTQMLNVALSLALAFVIEYVSGHYPSLEKETYGVFFLAGGALGLAGAAILWRVPEPVPVLADGNLFKLFSAPLRDGNFQRLLAFNSGWVFAVNLASPFFTVFMMKGLGLSLPYIIGLNIVSQVTGILSVRAWGAYADRYSNKTIIALSGPLYILCLIAWCFVGLYTDFYPNLILLVIIHIFMGFSNAGVNLSITNMGLKLSPTESAIVYLSARNMVLALFGALAPLAGGRLADYFTARSLTVNAEWVSPGLEKTFFLVSLHEWNFLFLIGAVVALIAIQLLVYVRETGEVEKELVIRIMRHSMRTKVKDFFVVGLLISWHQYLWTIIKRRLYLDHSPDKSSGSGKV